MELEPNEFRQNPSAHMQNSSTHWTCEVKRMGENSSFIFICYVKTVPVYDFVLVCVVLYPSVKEFFKTIY